MLLDQAYRALLGAPIVLGFLYSYIQRWHVGIFP